MSGYLWKGDVTAGVKYLTDTYPYWWQKVNVETLDMSDVLRHVLAQVTGKLVYETKEFIFWSPAALLFNGFRPHDQGESFPELTEEWRMAVKAFQRERPELLDELNKP